MLDNEYLMHPMRLESHLKQKETYSLYSCTILLISKKARPKVVMHRAAIAHTHGTECRTERDIESLEEGAVAELSVWLRDVNTQQCSFSIVFHNEKQKARLAVSTLINFFSTNYNTHILVSTNLYPLYMHVLYLVLMLIS